MRTERSLGAEWGMWDERLLWISLSHGRLQPTAKGGGNKNPWQGIEGEGWGHSPFLKQEERRGGQEDKCHTFRKEDKFQNPGRPGQKIRWYQSIIVQRWAGDGVLKEAMAMEGRSGLSSGPMRPRHQLDALPNGGSSGRETTVPKRSGE